MPDLTQAVQKFCDELCAHDLWMWGNTCQHIINDIDYNAPSIITKERITATMKDGRTIELTYAKDGSGWSIGTSKPKQ